MKKDDLNFIRQITKDEVIDMLTELQTEFEEEKQDMEHMHYDDLENAERYNTGIDTCIDIIQDRIDKLKEIKE